MWKGSFHQQHETKVDNSFDRCEVSGCDFNSIIGVGAAFGFDSDEEARGARRIVVTPLIVSQD